MAAALSASPWGPSRARAPARTRAGLEPGKIQPLSAARVTHGAGTWGGWAPVSFLRSGAGRLWGLGRACLLRRDGNPWCSQTPLKIPLPYTAAHTV